MGWRVDTREVNGETVLFAEEVQSHWHQTGRKEGYQHDPFKFGTPAEQRPAGERLEAADRAVSTFPFRGSSLRYISQQTGSLLAARGAD
jgi:hypothetical protein